MSSLVQAKWTNSLAYPGEPFGCVQVIPTQQQAIDFHRKRDPQVVAKSYENGNVIIITSRRRRIGCDRNDARAAT